MKQSCIYGIDGKKLKVACVSIGGMTEERDLS